MAKAVYQSTATDGEGNVLDWPFTVTVRRDKVAGNPLARIYADDADDALPLSNPMVVTESMGWAKGFFRFYATGDFYRIDTTKDGLAAEPLRDVGIGTYQGADQGALNDPGYLFEYEAEVVAPPTSGFFRLDNEDISLATTMWVSKTTRGGYDVAARLLELDPGASTKKNTLIASGAELGGATWLVDAANDDDGAGGVHDYVTITLSGHTGSTEFITSLFSLQREIAGSPGTNGTNGASALTVVRVVDTTGGNPVTDYENGDTVDGVVLVTGDLVLRATPGGNVSDGIRVVAATGAAFRHASFATFDAHPGCYFSVSEGTVYADTLWRCTSDKGGTINVTPLEFGQSVTDTSAIEADISNIHSRLDAGALELAALRGSLYGFPNGLADDYGNEDYVDTGASSGVVYDAVSDLYYPPLVGGGTTQTLSEPPPAGTVSFSPGFTVFNVAVDLTDGDIIYEIGVYLTNAQTITVKIGRALGGATFDIPVSQSFSHPGGGWANCVLAAPYTIVAGINNVGVYVTDAGVEYATVASGQRAFKAGDITGNGQAGFTVTGTQVPLMRVVKNYTTVGNMTLVSDAIAVTAQPDTARIAVFIDPQEAITINTDYTAEVSRDGGTTWSPATLALVSNPVGTVEQYEDNNIDISAQPAGTSMLYRKKSLNNKDIDDTGVVFNWR